jgi:ABC-2 type transport system permease protein
MLTIYHKMLNIAWTLQFQYRVAMAIWMIEIILPPTIYLVVWQAASAGGDIGGYTQRDFAAYYIVLLVVHHFTQQWHMWNYELYIRQGMMSPRLLRPVHPIHQDFAENVSYKILLLAVVIPSLLFLIVIFRPALNPPLWAIPAFVLALLLAWVLAFVLGWVVAMAAFWTTRTMAVNQMYFIVMFFASGQLAPLDLLPAPLRLLADALPFRWIFGFPVELLLGRVSPDAVLIGFGAQIAWIAAVCLLLSGVWRASVRRYGAVGG